MRGAVNGRRCEWSRAPARHCLLSTTTAARCGETASLWPLPCGAANRPRVPEKRIKGLGLMLYRPAGESTGQHSDHALAAHSGLLPLCAAPCGQRSRDSLHQPDMVHVHKEAAVTFCASAVTEHSLSSGPSRPGAKNAEDGVDSHCRVFCRSVSRCLIALTPLFTLTAGVSTSKSGTSYF